MAQASKFAYTYQDSDISLGHVANRYGTTVREIWTATAGSSKKFKNLNEREFMHAVLAGDSILVPLKEDPWEWRVVTPRAPTLKGFCAQKPEPARVGGPPLTPELLWFHPRNDFFRARVLKALASEDARRERDKDPGAAPFEAGEQIFVPYPVREKAHAVMATPAKGGGASAVVETTPEWISELRAIDQKVARLVDEIRRVSKVCMDLQAQGQICCFQLAALMRLITLELEHASVGNKLLLEALQKQFAGLQREATDLLFADPAGKLGMPEAETWKKLSGELLRELRGERLKELAVRAQKEHRQRVMGTSVAEIADRINIQGYGALWTSPKAGEAKKDIDEAFALLSGANDRRPVLSNASSALSAMVNAKLNVVGNLPGPSSLYVALVEMHVMMGFSKTAGRIAKFIETVKMPKGAMAVPGIKGAADYFSEGLGWNEIHEYALDLQSKLGRAASLSGDEMNQLDQALLSGNKSSLREIAAMIASKTHSSVDMHRLMTALNLISLLLVVASVALSDDPGSLTNVLSLLGGATGTAVGFMQVAASLHPGGAWAEAFESVGPYFGTVSTLTSLVTGALTALIDEDRWDAGVAAAQMVGGYLSVAGFMVAVPGLQVAGTTILIFSAALSLWATLKDVSAPGAKKVLLAQLGALKERALWARMTSEFPYLATSLDSVVRAINDPSHAGLFQLTWSPKIAEILRTTGFSAEDISRIAQEPSLYPEGFL